MARDFNILGPALVRLGFGPHINDTDIASGTGTSGVGSTADGLVVYELGLSLEDIRIHIRQYHQSIFIDGYGMEVAAERITQLAEAFISINLIHYDPQVIQMALSETQGGVPNNTITNAGLMQGAGILLGGGKRAGQSGNHYMELQILPQYNGSGFTEANRISKAWRFPTTLLVDRTEIPVGATKISVLTNWLAVPYPVVSEDINQELVSKNTILYDHTIAELVSDEE